MAEQNAQNQAQSSPRRVAVPVLVKDGKPCSGGSEPSMSRTQQSHCGTSHHSPHQPAQHQQPLMYQRQTLQHHSQPQQANMCSSYLPIQGRAW
ncbi:DNA binding [Homalodisca vitripennis]|nr:DNA binding [Homalodisca vitripennis]